MNRAEHSAPRLVVKIGTNLLAGKQAFDGHYMEQLVRELCALKRERGYEILVVSSGAVGCGMEALGLTERPKALAEKQAVAAVGQARLMHYYETLVRVFGKGEFATAQVLLTQYDLENRTNYLHVRNTLLTLLKMGRIIPILNENDSTAIDELRFGDNDTLAAKIAAKINADLLLILTDVDGLFDRNPAKDPDARLIHEVEQITDTLAAVAGDAGSIASTGGMRTKLEAARIACAAGVVCVIANGTRNGIVSGVLDQTMPCTRFKPSGDAISHRKRWIAFGRLSRGVIQVDDGAAHALREKGSSLLPAGITGVDGEFPAGATVSVADESGRVLARGITNYDAATVRRIMRLHTPEVRQKLGARCREEVIHRDNLVVLTA
ncbi:MAG TPA: glutamate 5-kinase [Candidatus Hydrogenedentes bacterium]|nr:glutamate 5-kinase [Candidatus Hydrogenedentota bacterium]HOJ67226.1 glutamate 5-kinase [Candidatus Hydrogenedentota bacterium]HOK90610.1 glutamate 5-kinase [Candidatus Hydrogenedentota bacterium]